MEKLKVLSKEFELFSRLLQVAHIVTEAQIKEATDCAKRLDISLDRALIMLNLASAGRLKPVMTAKDMVVAGEISLSQASSALQLAVQNGTDFKDTLSKKNEAPSITKNDEAICLSTSKTIHPLADLLMNAKLISPEQLNQAIQRAADMNLPLGKSLVVNKFMNRWVFGQVITAAFLIREEKIAKNDAAKLLQESVQRKITFLQLLFESGKFSNQSGDNLTLPELLVMAECLTEADYQDIQERKLLENRSFADIISSNHLVESSLLQSSVALLEMVGSYLKPFQAAEALKQVSLKKIPVYQAIAELKPPPQVPQPQLRLGDLLVESGIIGRDSIENIISKQDPNSSLVRIGKTLLAAHLIDDNNLYYALRCQSAFKEGVISAKHAVAVLSCAYDEKIKIEDAFIKCGVFAPMRMQWNWK